MLELFLIQHWLWAITHSDEYDRLVRQINHSAMTGSIPAPENLSDLAKLILVAQHEKASARTKEMVEKLRHIYGV